jgi:hypothetical protein
VQDNDTFSNDDIGKVSVPLDEIVNRSTIDRWFGINQGKDGEIKVKVEFSPSS